MPYSLPRFTCMSFNPQEDKTRKQDRQKAPICATLNHSVRFCRLITVIQLRLRPFPYSQALIYKLQLL